MAEFLAIKNWEKRQPGRKGKSEWIKDYTDKDSHERYEKLSFYQRYVLDGLRRLRGKRGENIPNDPMYIARSLHALRTDRPHVQHAVSTLLAHGFLILTNQQVDFLDKEKEIDKEKEKEEIKPSAQKPRRAIPKEQVLPVDSRHIRIKSLICNAYEQENQAQCPWDGSEGKQLKAFLDSTPQWVDSQVAQCLVHMYGSAGFAKGTRPREFLPRLPKYLHGPLNEFNREQTNGNNKTAGRNSRNLEAIVSVAMGNSVRGSHVSDSGAIQHGTDRDSGRETSSIPNPEILAREPT